MAMAQTAERFKSFKEFYPFYLSEHKNTICRSLHFVGSTLILLIIAATVITGKLYFLWFIPLAGYGFAWVGHFGFEHNRPATFKYPFYSFAGDWVMYAHLWTRRIKFDGRLDSGFSTPLNSASDVT